MLRSNRETGRDGLQLAPDQGPPRRHRRIIQTRGVLKKELTAQLRTARRMRRPKSHNAKSGQGHTLDMVSSRERLAEIKDRAVPGHWGGPCKQAGRDRNRGAFALLLGLTLSDRYLQTLIAKFEILEVQRDEL